MDPYRILGVSRDASDDEIKKAYRSLSRKYHPDANVNNPNRAQAEERFKEIQQAYDTIMKERQQGAGFGGYGGYGGYGGFGGYGGGFGGYGGQREAGYDRQESNEMRAAVNYINSGHYREALNALDGIPDADRDGRWYFYAAIASDGVQDMVNAREYISRAIALEPGNIQYRQFQQHLEFGNNWYETRGGEYQGQYCGVGRWCLNMMLLNALCNCLCLGPRCM